MLFDALALPALAAGNVTPAALAAAGSNATGDTSVRDRLAAVLDPGDQNFPIVTP
ncbi:alkyl sulfatase C-terminal domain-containing protein [Streptomyces sp. NPDC059906]|uniref:alkyl sulfatase C-terminal domain-containing protein n=1 Tax=Streptomyces sp. NPDC059906 TaxID=3346997 RepID=UPI003657F8D1